MEFCVSNLYPEYNYMLSGVSYAGSPYNNTAMYITYKVRHLIMNLEGHTDCLCFVENGIDVPESIIKKNAIIRCANPTYEYAKLALAIEKEIRNEEKKKGYMLTNGGYYIGDDVSIGNNAYIEPNAIIGHGVVIGNNAIILAGAVVKHAVIGDDFICNENAVIGNYSFTQAEDDNGNRFRIPALGSVIIGNNVEVGACCDIAMGTCGETILEDYVKLDSLVHIGHEAHLYNNVEVTAGGIVGGFSKIEQKSYLGINSCIRNRINIGDRAVIGMGAVVTKSVAPEMTVIGNPAKDMKSIG